MMDPGFRSKRAELTVIEKSFDFQVIGRVAWCGSLQPAQFS
jgi:hypothetical protein